MYCYFCQRFNKYRKVCLTCRSGFVKWVNTHIVAPDDSTCSLTMAAHIFLKKVTSLPESLYEEYPIDSDFNSEPPVSDNPRHWPGFYLGHFKWVHPNHIIYLKESLTVENAETQLGKVIPDGKTYYCK